MSVLLRAVELRPDLSCLWKLLGDACTAISAVSPNRAQVLVPAPLAGLDCSTQSHMLNQTQTLKVGERYDPTTGTDIFQSPYTIVTLLILHICTL